MTSLARKDYQEFDFSPKGELCVIGERMESKLSAIPLPDLTGRTVLDVGCDMGFWSFLASERGAAHVVGIDRNRPVKGNYTDLVTLNKHAAAQLGSADCIDFYQADIGKQWFQYGTFDVVFLFSLYHHIYAQVGDHRPIWYWLRTHMLNRGMLLWENPVDCSDPVSAAHIPDELKAGYTRAEILVAASEFFTVEHIGEGHVSTREVYRFTAKALPNRLFRAEMKAGSGGAYRAWEYAGQRRQREFADALGAAVIPGSLNTMTSEPFHWDTHYFRAQFLDVADRSVGIDGEWVPRWARVYPCRVNNVPSWAFRFEGEAYPTNFVEFVSTVRLRNFADSGYVEVLS